MVTLSEQPLEERLQFLRPLAPWSALSEEALRAVAAAMQPRRYEGDQLIIRQGETGSHLHIVTSGRAEARVHSAAGVVAIVATMGEGDCFGEMSLLSGDPTSADVAAVEDAETLTLDREAFNALVAAHPGVLREFVGMISRRLRVTDVAVGAARQKEQELAHFLQEEKSERYGDLVGKHPSIKELQRQLEQQAQRDGPLLIEGERGTGKEVVVRRIHFHSRRKDAPLLCTDCAQIAETPWGDKLFGDYHSAVAGPAHTRAVCYMDLAEGGTILLKNIDALPPAIQERLARFLTGEAGSPGAPPHNVRVIATCRACLAELAAAGRMSPALVAALAADVVTVPALRERKKDIPELAGHFVRKHAQRLDKPVTGLHDQALIKLVSYDYRFANVRELEEAVERAVILTDDAVIDAEEILLGPPPDVRPLGFNLLRLPAPLVRPVLRLFPRVIQGITAAVFALILYACFFAPMSRGENLGTLLVWSLWWPALPLLFFFAARIWCAVCPMALAGVAAQQRINLKWRIPGWMKSYDSAVMMAGFFAIVWVEEVTAMRHDARATGWLLLAILSGAVVTSVLFPRRTWCRHLCPLGGYAGLCSATALVELRPTSDVCAAKCRDHSCYKGSGGADGCPMFNHVMFVDSNQHCVLCLNCVRSCPNGSPLFNLRVPARELWTSPSARPEISRFIAMLMGLLVGITLIQQWERLPRGLFPGLLDAHRFLFVSSLLALSAAAPLLGVALAVRRLGKAPDLARADRFWQRMGAWVPLLTAGYVCYQLGFVPGLDRLEAMFRYQPPGAGAAYILSVSLLAVLRTGILAAGLATTTGVMWKLWQARERNEGKTWLQQQAGSLMGAAAYGALLLVLMLRPDWLTG